MDDNNPNEPAPTPLRVHILYEYHSKLKSAKNSNYGEVELQGIPNDLALLSPPRPSTSIRNQRNPGRTSKGAATAGSSTDPQVQAIGTPAQSNQTSPPLDPDTTFLLPLGVTAQDVNFNRTQKAIVAQAKQAIADGTITEMPIGDVFSCLGLHGIDVKAKPLVMAVSVSAYFGATPTD